LIKSKWKLNVKVIVTDGAVYNGGHTCVKHL